MKKINFGFTLNITLLYCFTYIFTSNFQVFASNNLKYSDTSINAHKPTLQVQANYNDLINQSSRTGSLPQFIQNEIRSPQSKPLASKQKILSSNNNNENRDIDIESLFFLNEPIVIDDNHAHEKNTIGSSSSLGSTKTSMVKGPENILNNFFSCTFDITEGPNSDTRVFFNKIKYFLTLKNYSEIIKLIKPGAQLIGSNDQLSRICIAYGIACQNLGDILTAIKIYGKASKLRKSVHDKFYLSSYYGQYSKELLANILSFEEYSENIDKLESKNQKVDLYIQCGEFYELFCLYSLAINAYDKALILAECNEQKLRIYTGRGRSHHNILDYKKEKEILDWNNALKLPTTDEEKAYLKIYTAKFYFYKECQLQKGIKELKDAKDLLNPDDSKNYKLLELIYKYLAQWHKESQGSQLQETQKTSNNSHNLTTEANNKLQQNFSDTLSYKQPKSSNKRIESSSQTSQQPKKKTRTK